VVQSDEHPLPLTYPVMLWYTQGMKYIACDLYRAYCPVLRDCVATGPGVRDRSPDRPYPGPGGALGAGLLTAPPRPFGSVSSTCARSDNRSRTNRGR